MAVCVAGKAHNAPRHDGPVAPSGRQRAWGSLMLDEAGAVEFVIENGVTLTAAVPTIASRFERTTRMPGGCWTAGPPTFCNQRPISVELP